MERVRTLVFPCGAEAGAEIAQALERSVHVELYGASSRDDHGRHLYRRYATLPGIAEPAFDERFGELLARWGIELVFATHDSVLEYLAPRMARWGARLVNGDPEATRIARRKSATYALFSGEPWVPRRYAGPREVRQWPVLLKPDCGQGGQGVTLASDLVQAEAAWAALDEPLLCEYLPGEELTIDCFTDGRRRLLHVGPRTRERVVGGIAMRSRPLPASEAILGIANAINDRLTMRGPWFFQLKADAEGLWKLLEVSCRLSSCSAVQRAAGVNLPLMAVQDHLERPLTVLADTRLALVERRIASVAEFDYAFDTAYLDFDDTLICDGAANPQAMRFAYRLLEMGKRLVLVTRHAGDVGQTLRAMRIAENLFDEIVHLREGEPKSACIRPPAIFVDNHFPERLEVSRRCGIPVFDVDALELLFP